jgi:four helix bundle protein
VARARHFRDLPVWGKAMVLAREVYAGTEPFPQAETIRLLMQIPRSAPGAASHIVEGHLTDSELRKSFGAARGALFEFELQSELANGVGSLQKALCGEAAGRRDKDSRTHRTACWAYWSPEMRQCGRANEQARSAAYLPEDKY